ncbi:MAG: hypothetical protein BA865_12405 [Desulfobacterales bacterium S5133MH4]|nr:MAG: hypothetical protein BA865_12405 [Desulfobacterales bacterium S5133MH4]
MQTISKSETQQIIRVGFRSGTNLSSRWLDYKEAVREAKNQEERQGFGAVRQSEELENLKRMVFQWTYNNDRNQDYRSPEAYS